MTDSSKLHSVDHYPLNSSDTSSSTQGQRITVTEKKYPAEVPQYMQDTYHWAYISPKNVDLLDKEWIVWALLFLNAGRLKRFYLDHIQPNTRVWQIAHVYGNLVKLAAEKVGEKGCFNLTDVMPVQVEHGKRKTASLPQASVILADADQYQGSQPYHLICSFFLLHEVPDDKKRSVIANMLRNLAPDGEIIIVDYHKPKLWNPLYWILAFVNHFLEPYAKSLWKHEIHEFGISLEKFNITKRTCAGGAYQMLHIRHKTG